MHPEAFDWVQRHVPDHPVSVLDVGGRDINGSPLDLFDHYCTPEVIDLHPGPRVTWVGDFADYAQTRPFDVCLYLEVAEHTPDWRDHIDYIFHLLDDRGVLIFTAAGPERWAHSAIDGGPLRSGEHYANVDPDDLAVVLHEAAFPEFVVDITPDRSDVRAFARR